MGTDVGVSWSLQKSRFLSGLGGSVTYVCVQLCVWLPESEPCCGKLPLLCFTVVGHRGSLLQKNNPETLVKDSFAS